MFAGLLALIGASVFAGAAVYVTVAEQPARLALDDRALLVQWKPSYKRGFLMQASIALVAFVLGAIAWWQSDHPAFLIGALLLLAGWPWTILVMMRTNKAILAIQPAEAGPQSRALIGKWGRLHLARVAFGVLGTIAMLWGCLDA